jgi:hypothetical protein
VKRSRTAKGAGETQPRGWKGSKEFERLEGTKEMEIYGENLSVAVGMTEEAANKKKGFASRTIGVV